MKIRGRMSLNWKRCVMRSINWCRFIRSALPGYLIIAAVVLMGLGGCGLIEERESTSYHIPNWTTDGEIIALKTWMKHRKTLITNSEPVGLRETVVLMGPNGENERELFEISLGSPRLVELSSQGTYVAILSGTGLYLYNRNGDILKVLEIDLSAISLDFNLDETKLYVSIGYSDMLIYSVPDMVLEESNGFGGGGGFVDSINIVYYDWENSKMSLYNTETDVKTLQPVQLVPDIYSVITNKVHTIGSNVI